MRQWLNGDDWSFKGYVGLDWVWRHAEKQETRDKRGWMQGTVPGSVHHDLLRLGEIPDPYFERNSLLCEWVPSRTWVYRKVVQIEAPAHGEKLWLHFEGVDYSANFYLNGVHLGRHEGMFTQVRFDVTDLVLGGEDNVVVVILDPAPDEQPQVGKTSLVHTHKSRMTYWWDFCPRMIHIGIWDDVYLERTGQVVIRDVYSRATCHHDFTEGQVATVIQLWSGDSSTVTVDTVLTRLGQTISAHSETVTVQGTHTLQHNLTVSEPDLWWPNGSGNQALYELSVTVKSADGLVSDTRTHRLGFRTIELVQNEGASPDAPPYTLVVNGVRTYIKGWNWVPIDVMYGVPKSEKLSHLLLLAQEAHVNLLRVWGGGLIEQTAFYDLCDELGLIVWQEFIQSSSGVENKTSEEDWFIQMMVHEAEQIIPRRRNHPSLAIWCGGNELQDVDGVPLTEDDPCLAALRDVVHRLHPDASWLPTSPTGPVFGNTLENIGNNPNGLYDVHGPWEHQGLTGQYTLYNAGTSMLHSEFGVEGMANLRTLFSTIASVHQWPANRDNPVVDHRGSWWINEPLVQYVFGGIETIPELSRASQFLQAEGLRYALEANRRRAFQNSGSIPWQFNESYPNAWCTAAVDYYARPKAAYYTVSRAFAPLTVTASFAMQAWSGQSQFQADVWVNNDAQLNVNGPCQVQARLVGMTGRVFGNRTWRDVSLTDVVTRVGTVEVPLVNVLDDVFFLDLAVGDATGRLISHNRYPFVKTETLAPTLVLPETRLEVAVEAVTDLEFTVRVQNAGDTVAFCIRIEDTLPLNTRRFISVSDGHFSLLPGEQRVVNVRPRDRSIFADGLTLDVMSWNSVPVQVTLKA